MNEKESTKVEKQVNKIKISTLKILIPNFNKSIYFNLTVNNTESLQSPVFMTGKNSVDLNFTYLLKTDDVKSLKFTIYEKASIFSNPIFKGENKANDFEFNAETSSFICYMNNSSNESVGVLYFTMDFPAEKNPFDYFQQKLQNKESISTQQTEKIVEIKDNKPKE